MHKKFWVSQDWPFYWKKKTNCEHFYYRIMKGYSHYFGQFISDNSTSVDNLNLNRLHQFSKDRNAKSYLFFAWKMDWTNVAYSYAEMTSPISYAPLQEIELVRYSYSILPKGKRMNMFHRQLTTRANKKAARVPTVYETTASSELLYILRDIFAQGVYEAKRVVRHLARRLFKVKVFTDNVLLQDIDPQLRALKTSREAVQWAKNRGYLSNDATAENIPVALLSKMINLHFLSQELGC